MLPSVVVVDVRDDGVVVDDGSGAVSAISISNFFSIDGNKKVSRQTQRDNNTTRYMLLLCSVISYLWMLHNGMDMADPPPFFVARRR